MPKTEIYIRFDGDMGAGLHETPAASLEEAAGRFVEDADNRSVMALRFQDDGRLMASLDVTDKVMGILHGWIAEGRFEECPHPMLADAHDAWRAEDERLAREDAEHERIERAMLMG